MIKVLPGSRGLIKRLQSIGGENISNYLGIGTYYYYYIETDTKHIKCLHKNLINNENFIICKTFEEYKNKQILINYQEI